MESDDYKLAEALVRDAGALAAQMRAKGIESLKTKQKTSITDVATTADHAAEELVAARLREERPEDGLVGEEGTAKEGTRTWYIDPVDGTYNFLWGLPFWSAAVALADADGPILGAIYHPAADEVWVGGRDHPMTCNGKPVPRVKDRPLAELSIASYIHPARLVKPDIRKPMLRVIAGTATLRMLGSSSVELAYVGHGRLGAWMQPDSLPWDWYPGVALVESAGGATEVVEYGGHTWHIAGPPTAVAQAAALVRDEGVVIETERYDELREREKRA